MHIQSSQGLGIMAEERARTIERLKGGGELQRNSVFLHIKVQWHI